MTYMRPTVGGPCANRIARFHHPAAGRRWSIWTSQVMLVGERARRGARRHAELRVDVLQVPGDRVLADDERRGDVAVAVPRSDQPQHLQLALAEPMHVR